MNKSSTVVKGTTCFSMHSKYGADCNKKDCDNWVNNKNDHNCILLTAQSGPKTLLEIGEIYDLTRMRICQIEKNIYKKLRVLLDP